MTREIEIAELQAAATPRDWPQDIPKQECGWQVCERCLHYFLGVTSRIKCRQCAEEGTL